MIKTLAASLATALVAIASPAFAEGAKAVAEPVAANAAVTAPGAAIVADKPARETRYCVTQDITGSLIPYHACRTRKDWLVRGFDPLAK